MQAKARESKLLLFETFWIMNESINQSINHMSYRGAFAPKKLENTRTEVYSLRVNMIFKCIKHYFSQRCIFCGYKTFFSVENNKSTRIKVYIIHVENNI